MSATDYYWIQWGNGKRYYLASTGAAVAKAKIPRDLLPHITEKDPTLRAQELGTTIRELKACIQHLRTYIATVSTVKANIAKKEVELQALITKFDKFPLVVQAKVSLEFDPAQYQFKPPTVKKKDSYAEELARRTAAFRQQYPGAFGKTTKASPKVPPQQPIPPRPVPKPTDEALLARHGITCKKEWKKWMMGHHPDKNPDGDLNVVQEVCAAATRIYRS